MECLRRAHALELRDGDFSEKSAKTMSLAVIEIIDLFLIGTVAYIVAVGIYRLFISNTEIDLPMRVKIDSLKDLEDKIFRSARGRDDGFLSDRVFDPFT